MSMFLERLWKAITGREPADAGGAGSSTVPPPSQERLSGPQATQPSPSAGTTPPGAPRVVPPPPALPSDLPPVLRALPASEIARLIAKLREISDLDQDQEVRAQALYTLAHLGQTAGAAQAAASLVDLMYCGDSRAWLASLVGTLPQADKRRMAADFCVERILDGSKHAWGQALAAMPEADRRAGWDALADRLDPSAAVWLVRQVWPVPPVAPPGRALPRIIAAMEGEEPEAQAEAAALILMSDEASSYHVAARDIVRAFLQEGFGDEFASLNGCGYHLMAALLLHDTDPVSRAKARSLLLGCLEDDSSRDNKLHALRAALWVNATDLAADMLAQAIGDGHYSVICDLLSDATDCMWRATLLPRLRVAFAAMPRIAKPLYEGLGCALGIPGFVTTSLIECEDVDGALWRIALIACGGEKQALGLLHGLAVETDRLRHQCALASDDRVNDLSSLQASLVCALSHSTQVSASDAAFRIPLLCNHLIKRPQDISQPTWPMAASCLRYIASACKLTEAAPEAEGANIKNDQMTAFAEVLDPLTQATQHSDGAITHWDLVATRILTSATFLSVAATSDLWYGKAAELDRDQQEAVEAIAQIDQAAEDIRNWRAGRAAVTLDRIRSTFPRLPYHPESDTSTPGTERLKIEAELYYLLMYCCVLFQTGQAIDPETAMASDSIFRATTLDAFNRFTAQKMIEYGRRARELARTLGVEERVEDCDRFLRSAAAT